MKELVVFKIAKEYYGINIQIVENIERMIPITRVPYAESHIKGVVNLRGDIIPVVDLRIKFSIPREEGYNENNRIIIAKFEEVKIGMIVDSSSEVLQLDEDNIDPAPQVQTNSGNKFIKEIGKHNGRIIMILNLEELLGLDKIVTE